MDSDKKPSALIEFLMILPIFLMVFGVMICVMIGYTQSSVNANQIAVQKELNKIKELGCVNPKLLEKKFVGHSKTVHLYECDNNKHFLSFLTPSEISKAQK